MDSFHQYLARRLHNYSEDVTGQGFSGGDTATISGNRRQGADIFGGMPADSGGAFMTVQHLILKIVRDNPSKMAQILRSALSGGVLDDDQSLKMDVQEVIRQLPRLKSAATKALGKFDTDDELDRTVMKPAADAGGGGGDAQQG